MFVWQGRRVTLPRRINATCCMQDTRAPTNERRTPNAYLHASITHRLNGAEALVGLGLVQRYGFTYLVRRPLVAMHPRLLVVTGTVERGGHARTTHMRISPGRQSVWSLCLCESRARPPRTSRGPSQPPNNHCQDNSQERATHVRLDQAVASTQVDLSKPQDNACHYLFYHHKCTKPWVRGGGCTLHLNEPQLRQS